MPIIPGKKCPRCGTSHYFPLPEQPWFLRLPGSDHLVCTDCGQDFYFFGGISVLHERRANERIQPPHTLLVRFGDGEQKFAQIRDISTEGIGFTYTLDKQKFLCDRLTIDLFNCKQGAFLKDLPVRIVSSEVSVQNVAGQPTTIMRNGARFIDLNRTQKKLLAHFIQASGRLKQPKRHQSNNQS